MDTKTRGEGGFWRGRLGALLGAALLTAVGFSITAAAQQLTTLYTFTGGDGAHPQSSLIADPSGKLYGTTRAVALAGRVRYSSWTPRGT